MSYLLLGIFTQAVANGFKNWKPYNRSDPDQYNYHYIYNPIASFYSEASYSPSGSFVQVVPVDEMLRPGTEQEITILYTADPDDAADIDWYFVVCLKNRLIKNKQTLFANRAGLADVKSFISSFP